jgi:hypothetical protein
MQICLLFLLNIAGVFFFELEIQYIDEHIYIPVSFFPWMAAWSPPATEEIGAMGREIESR